MHRRVSTAGAATSISVPTARLIESWASLKSFVRKDGTDAQKVQAAKEDDPGNPTLDLRVQKRCNATDLSRTDPESVL